MVVTRRRAPSHACRHVPARSRARTHANLAASDRRVRALADLYRTERGCGEHFFLFTGFHFTPVNRKIVTTAFLSLLPICGICLSVSYLSARVQCGGNNGSPEGTTSPRGLQLASSRKSTPCPRFINRTAAVATNHHPAQSQTGLSQHLWRQEN